MKESNYDDIINLEHPTSKVHPRMSLYKRSAQFAPFAALTGYNEAIIETSRQTTKRIEIDEGLKEVLNSKLQLINLEIKKTPLVTITYFVYDSKKNGGSYQEITNKVKRIDEVNQEIIFIDKKKIPITEIINIKIEEN